MTSNADLNSHSRLLNWIRRMLKHGLDWRLLTVCVVLLTSLVVCHNDTMLQALNAYEPCVAAWKRALALLPIENLTPAEKKQAQQYSAELKVATAKLEYETEGDLIAMPGGVVIPQSARHGDLPWQRAEKMLPHLRTLRGVNRLSSVSVHTT